MSTDGKVSEIKIQISTLTPANGGSSATHVSSDISAFEVANNNTPIATYNYTDNLTIDDEFILQTLSEYSEEPYEYSSVSNINDTKEVNQEISLSDYYLYQMEDIANKYLEKPAQECTLRELNNAYALSLVESVYTSASNGLKAQDDSDGIIREFFDLWKSTNGFEELTQAEVERALIKQEEILNTLKDTLKSGGNFEATWQELTGVEYNPDKIALYQQKSVELEYAQTGLAKVNNFYQNLSNDENMYDTKNTYNSYIEFFGQEKGEEKFLEALKYGYNNSIDSGIYDPSNPVDNIEFDENKNLIFKMQDGTSFELGKLENINPNNLTPTYSDKFQQKQLENYLSDFEKATGINYPSLIEEYNNLSNEALGNANAVNNILNDYIASQEGFIDEAASYTQIGGIGMMVAGGAMCFIPPLAGVGAMFISLGQGMAITGTFGDEIAEGIDTATNNQSFSEDLDEYREILKETLTDGALFASGYAIGNGASQLNKYIFSQSGNRLLAMAGEVGMDTTLSLLSDLAITGEIDLKGEGLSQFLGILTGCATAKLNQNIKYVSDDLTYVENIRFSSRAQELAQEYSSHIGEVEQEIRTRFEGLKTVQDENITARAKSEKSIFEKLVSKYLKGKLTSQGYKSSNAAISDAYGTRIQMNSVKPSDASAELAKALEGTDITEAQFIDFATGKTKLEGDAKIEMEQVQREVFEALKTKQAQEVVGRLISLMRNAKPGEPPIITELNNYGNEISAYFTTEQVKLIASEYYDAYKKPLTVVTNINPADFPNSNLKIEDDASWTVETKEAIYSNKGAIKSSGYTSSQMNTQHLLSDGTIGQGELQIRGTEVNAFADVEHIPYDIRQGKIKADDPKYADVYALIKGMDAETSYKKYNEYLTHTYNALRLKELGFEIPESQMPKIKDYLGEFGFTKDQMKLLSRSGLEALH